MDFMTTKEAEKKWNISERRIRKLLKDGRIIGSIKIGNSWSIPTNAFKPIDKRSIKLEDKRIDFDLDKMDLTEIEKLKEKVKVSNQTNINNLFLDWLYHANKLEGNTLSKEEINIVINNITVAGKTIEEHQEIINYNNVIKYITESLNKEKQITENDFTTIHSLISKNIDNETAGIYRMENINNGKDYQLIPELVKKQIANYNESNYPIIIKAIILHSELLKISPFKNNNRKIALLLLNLILLNNDYYPVFIKENYQKEYLTFLERAHLTGNYTHLINLLLDIEKNILEEVSQTEGGDK